ncbi:hypothetical protein AB0P21_32770 [Kribbella sp. NPDC056861]|uniref:hypothetical protein n=1 Tax=Kribbella sp. NPDC056861 TaxID=3154857 RepID=UPI003443A7D2
MVEETQPPLPTIPVPAALAKLEGRRERALRSGPRLSSVVLAAALGTGVTAVTTSPLLALAPGALTAGLAWWRWGRPAQLRRSTRREHQLWAAACAESLQRFEDDVRVWEHELGEQERIGKSRATSVAPWVPVAPSTKERVDLYGGSATGWRATLLAMGSSLMSAGARLTVVDLTQDGVAEPLRRMAESFGAPIRTTTVPDEQRALNLLADLSAEEIGVVVAESLYGADSGKDDSRDVDATLVQHLAECLTDGPVTFGRLHLALQVALRQLGPDDRRELSRPEYSAITDFLSEAARRTAEPRLFRLAAGVKRLAGSGGSEPVDSWTDEGISLRLMQMSDREPQLTAALLRQVIFQVVACHVQRGELTGNGERVVLIAGADGIPRADLERFDGLCRRNNLRLVLLFSHLRDDAVDLLGGGDAVVFMRLGNAKEAEQAATFIGRQHRLVASQFTYSRGTSTSVGTSDNTTRGNSSSTAESAGVQSSDSRQTTFGLLFSRRHRSGSKSTGEQYSVSTTGGTSWSESVSTSTQQGTNESTSVGHQRTYEYAVEPTVLQGLSPTAFIMVDPRDPASPRLGDCDPRLGRE